MAMATWADVVEHRILIWMYWIRDAQALCSNVEKVKSSPMAGQLVSRFDDAQIGGDDEELYGLLAVKLQYSMVLDAKNKGLLGANECMATAGMFTTNVMRRRQLML